MGGTLIAVDGPAGSGKSSVARLVAERLGVVNIGTGTAYRAVALRALRGGGSLEDGPGLAALAGAVTLDAGGARVDGTAVPEEELRAPEVSAAASKVSAHPEVREVLLGVQREAAERARERGGAVVEGRDIGTVVLPEADLKVYLSADPGERARRRAMQSGREGELERIRRAMTARDEQDTGRGAAPLRAAPDAEVLETTELGLEEVVERVLELARSLEKER